MCISTIFSGYFIDRVVCTLFVWCAANRETKRHGRLTHTNTEMSHCRRPAFLNATNTEEKNPVAMRPQLFAGTFGRLEIELVSNLKQ